MSFLTRAQELVAQLYLVIWMLRSGRKEVVAGTLGLVLFAAGTWLLTLPNLSPVPADFSNYAAYSLYGVGVLLWVYVFYRIRQQAVPPLLPPPELPPAAVKGPMAFGPKDGTLFQRLGRVTELTQLLSLILDDQMPLIVVRGESGVGKTSLLRAGLTYFLKDQNVQYLYWEAVPTQSPERLLYALQEQWQNSPTPQGAEQSAKKTKALSESHGRDACAWKHRGRSVVLYTNETQKRSHRVGVTTGFIYLSTSVESVTHYCACDASPMAEGPVDSIRDKAVTITRTHVTTTDAH
jgi:hypothetical protein